MVFHGRAACNAVLLIGIRGFLMLNVIDINDLKLDREFEGKSRIGSPKVSGEKLKFLREKLKILRRQLAQQLKVSVATIERWENSDVTPLSEDDVDLALSVIRVDDKLFADGRNLCFGRTPIRLIREMLDYTQAEFAIRYGYSLSHWKKIENHERSLDKKIIAELENEVRQMLVGEC
jgi:transcriptional regulator with XRE-family HTH domain